MKMTINAFLVLCFASGLQAIAEDAATPSTDRAAPQPAHKEWQPSTTHPNSFVNNIFYGGYINLSFGSYMVVGIEPMVGYRMTPKLATGVKVRYDYIRDDRYAETITTSTYGGSVFARYLVTPKFYAQVEPATYNYESFYYGGGSAGRDWVPMLLVGGGFIQPLSERSWLNIQLLFDVLNDENSPYDDWEPFFSIGVGAGF